MDSGKVLIVDDSLLVRNYLSKAISSIPNLEVVDTAQNGTIGFEKITKHLPDVVILDLEMQDGDGISVFQNIEDTMSFAERPFVIIYSSRARYGDPIFKKAIDFGFCDFVLKVEGTPESIIPNLKATLIPKIISGIEAKHTRSLLSGNRPTRPSFSTTSRQIDRAIHSTLETNIPIGLTHLDNILRKKIIRPKLLILGASTGGPQVVRSIMKNFDSDIGVPVVIIQHMPENFTKSFAMELQNNSNLPVHELKHNMPLEKGHGYVFPGGTHGRINAFGNMFVYYTDRNNYDRHPFKPSIDVAIDHLQTSFKGQVIGAILSGMGSDGAIGIKKLHSTGSLIFAQDEGSSIVWGMPGSVVKQNATDIMLSQNDLGVGIVKALKYYGLHP